MRPAQSTVPKETSISIPVGVKAGELREGIACTTETELGLTPHMMEEKEISSMEGEISIWSKAFSGVMLFLLLSNLLLLPEY